MKRNLFYVSALICSMSMFMACSDSEKGGNALPVSDVNATYVSGDASHQLVLTYSDAQLTGKSVTFNSADGKTATLTLKGAALSLTKADAALTGIANPGVIPGETSTVLTVNLTPVGETGYSFSGTDEANGRKIVYEGRVEKSKLTLDLDVTMPANELQGTWNLYAYDAFAEVFPIRSKWESEQKFNLQLELAPGMAVPMELQPGELIALMSVVPMIPAGERTLSLQEVISTVLQKVTFKTDGNIVASYSDAANIAAPSWKESPLNMAQYAVKDGKLYVYLNADALVQLIMGSASTKALDSSSILTAVLPGLMNLMPMLSTGIPLGYQIADTGVLGVYLDKEVGMQLVNALLPLLQNQNIIAAIKAAAASNPDFASYAGMLDDILAQFPTVAQKTTVMELGLNFSKAAE